MGTTSHSGLRPPPPDPVKISHKEMAAKFGHIDFMFLGPPLTGHWICYCHSREYGVVGRGDMSYIFMLCSCRLNKCSISYWQSIMNFNTIKQQIEIKIMKNRLLYSLLLVSIIYLVLFYFNFTAYIGDYFEEEKYGFCIHCNGSVMCGTCKCARTLLHWIVKWWWLGLLHTLWSQ